jgi:hypothetical protein
MHWFSDPAGFPRRLAKTPPTMLPSAPYDSVGTPIMILTRLNNPPAHTPTDASPPPSRTADARLGAIAIR